MPHSTGEREQKEKANHILDWLCTGIGSDGGLAGVEAALCGNFLPDQGRMQASFTYHQNGESGNGFGGGRNRFERG